MTDDWRRVIWNLRVPIPPYAGTPLDDRCPLIGKGCGSVCRYDIPTTVDPGHWIKIKKPDGTLIDWLVRTAKGKIDGHCLVKEMYLKRKTGNQ